MAKNDILIRSKKKKAAALLVAGDLQAAKSLYEQLSKKAGLDIEVWANLSVVNRNLGLWKEATECSAKAIKLNSRSPEINFVHACSLQGQELLDESIKFYEIAIQFKPDYADAFYQLGNIYRVMGELDKSEKNYLVAIQHKPDYLEALSNLGALFVSAGKKKQADDILKRADVIRPNCEQVLCNLGNLCLSYGKEDEAVNYAKRVISINPGFSDAHALLGRAYRAKGKFDASLACYEQVLKIAPGDEENVAAISEIYELRGDYEAAFKLIDPIIEKGKALPLTLVVFAALSRRYNLQGKAISLLEDALIKAKCDLSLYADMHRSLGMLYDQSGMYDKAFEHYKKFNDGLSVLSVDEDVADNRHNKIIKTMGEKSVEKDFWQNLTRSNNASEKPVFVVGMPRSGTTLTEQILSSHPDIHGAGELSEIGSIAYSLADELGSGAQYPQCLERLTVSMLDGMADRYLELLNTTGGSSLRVVDKMPSNFLHIGLISMLFPNSKIIHICRDPVDTCLSIYFQKFGPTQRYTTDLIGLGNYYNQYRRLMGNWKEAFGQLMLEVSYENLINDQEKVSREMIEFCGLDWDENCLSFHKSKRDVNTPSYYQVRQPIYTKSAGRWKNYEHHLEPLIKILDKADSEKYH